ncbi:retron St85 family effector protein [Rhodobacteraceae bacterium M382]|nr:retron St85 family effector protein [Rhodobacteraceae bacterium M382]
MIDDVLRKFVDLIDLEKSRILQSPPIVFLCGGEVDIEKTSNHSIRNMFMNILGKSEFEELAPSIKLAEDFKNWHLGYENLSAFENDIASLSSYIVVILESAGSLAELGLFYANSNLKSKLVVIVRDEHYDASSFIKLGLIQPLKEASNDSVFVYKLDPKDVEKIKVSEVREIVDDIHELVKDVAKTSKFNALDRGHVLYLIFQLIDLFHALKKTEIEGCLKALDVPKQNLNSGLYILQSLGFIRCVRKSNIDFFITQVDSADRVHFGYTPQINDEGKNIHIKDSEIKIEYMSFINSERSTLNRRRKSAIASKGA